jgi:hypothetical protein
MNTKQNNNLPKEYFLGQEYFNDIDFIDIAIKVEILYKTLVDNFFFKYPYSDKELAISWTQKNAMVQILIEDVRIPCSLLNDLKTNKSGQYILAFINKILPEVNNELRRQKYRTGNILISNISFLDIQKITLIYFEEKKGWQNIIIPWTFFPKQFPPLQKFPWQEYPPIYIRDYIDAMEMYIKYDFDECIRKIITSLEGCFRYYKLKVTKNWIIRIFPSVFDHLMYPKGRIIKLITKYITQPVIQRNMIFIYNLRNKIVHEGFSLKPEQGWICKKAIGTMSYVFQHFFIKPEEKEYIFSLVMQFLLITQEIRGIDLEEIRVSHKKIESLSEREKEKLVIKTPKDLDNFIFSGLEITEKEKRKIIKE